jgi:hypothetical protein
MTYIFVPCVQLDDWVLCRIYRKSGQASPMVPPLADYEHLDHDDPSSGGFDDICSFYAPTSSSGATTSSTTASSAFIQQQPPALLLPRLPKIPSISELLDEYAFAQIFDTAGPAEQDPLAVHPSLNQLLAVGDSAHSDLTIYSPPPVAGGKRKATSSMGPDECGGMITAGRHQHPPAKSSRLNGSCLDAPQPASSLPATSSVLGGGLKHHMLPQF